MCSTSLKVSTGRATDDSGIRGMVPDISESIFKGFKSRSKKIGLWFALKHVIDDDYEAIPEQHQDDLISSMKKYIEYVEGEA